ncbi:hypothetical protein E1A91_D10G054700v1 [Gossypium mustelinum]|uniref:Uncharacterized protein n=1 Tax=Gossypium mustelinum TaxID=34275 RepID=A0A5D2T3J3_GOSMU|nr:hypothetical protein E1A91_D10G054700v1 [Gossypium mustelinum]
MISSEEPPSCSKCLVVLFVFFIACTKYCNAQTPTATTDPSEGMVFYSSFSRTDEMTKSIKIIQQVLEGILGGSI